MNVLLWLAYKGTRYAGFQVQPNAPTVCQTLQDAMQAVLGARPRREGCVPAPTPASMRGVSRSTSTMMEGCRPNGCRWPSTPICRRTSA